MKGNKTMTTMDVKKMGGYCMMIGPVIALTCYFIQPGGVLGIGGTVDGYDAPGVISILSENSGLGIITSLLIPVGLLLILGGIIIWVQSWNGTNGYALGIIAIPMAAAAIIGWTIASGFSIALASGIATDTALAEGFFGLNIIGTFVFGAGATLLAIGAASRSEINTNFANFAALSGTVVAVSSAIAPFATDSGSLIQIISGLCFFIYSIWFVVLGRTITSN
tara:strand:+ start:1505 stop:2170 length:666 start_codon:yes stop_codon:yes gene_type:complete